MGGQVYFPLFIDIHDKRIKVFGGGSVAARRIKTLWPFAGSILVIAPEVCDDITRLTGERLRIAKRSYRQGDCRGADIVLAATNNRKINRQIYEECQPLDIWVNIADKKEECNFFFPSLIKKGEMVIGLTAGGRDHALVKKTRIKIEKSLTEDEKYNK